MRASEMRRFVAMLAVALVVSCGEEGPAGDGGQDATVADAERDASRGAGEDGGWDGGRDAGSAEWIELPGLPDACRIEMATDPNGAVGRFEMEPCPGWEDGCRQLVKTWPTTVDTENVFRALDGQGYHDGEHGYWMSIRPTTAVANSWTLSVSDEMGDLLLAVRGPFIDSSCQLDSFSAIGEGRFAISASRYVSSEIQAWIGSGTLSDPVGSFQWRTDFRSTTVFIQDIQVGAERLAVGTAPAHVAYNVGEDGTLEAVGSFDLDGNPAYLKGVVGDAILYDSYGAPHRVHVSLGGSPGVPLVDPEGAEAIFAHTDRRDLVWLQLWGRSDDLRFERVELWTSPWVTNPAELAPRSVAGMPFTDIYDLIAVGFGRAAVLEQRGDEVVTAVYRLDDGSRTEFRAPDGTAFWAGAGRILYMGPEEMAVGVGTRIETTTVMFVRYDALAP